MIFFIELLGAIVFALILCYGGARVLSKWDNAQEAKRTEQKE